MTPWTSPMIWTRPSSPEWAMDTLPHTTGITFNLSSLKWTICQIQNIATTYFVFIFVGRPTGWVVQLCWRGFWDTIGGCPHTAGWERAHRKCAGQKRTGEESPHAVGLYFFTVFIICAQEPLTCSWYYVLHYNIMRWLTHSFTRLYSTFLFLNPGP